MNKFCRVLFAGFLLFTGCAASQKGPEKIYTQNEKRQMTYCIGMADTVRYVAMEKIRGVPQKKVRAHYAGKAHEKMNLAIVDKVYKENVTLVWDYTVGFFNECALNMADVPKERSPVASNCMENQLIADVAFAYKKQGAPVEKAYAHFSGFKNKTFRQIIDRVYASPQTRGRIKMDVWNDCINGVSK